VTGTVTSRLGLYKPDPDDDVTVETDINENYDKLDALFPPTVCTSGTRPLTPFIGQLIYETDTSRLVIRTADGKWTTITPRAFANNVHNNAADFNIPNAAPINGTGFDTSTVCKVVAIPADGTSTQILTFSGSQMSTPGPADTTGTDGIVIVFYRCPTGVNLPASAIALGSSYHGKDIGQDTAPSGGSTVIIEFTPPNGTWDYRAVTWRTDGTKTGWKMEAGTSYANRLSIAEKPGAKY